MPSMQKKNQKSEKKKQPNNADRPKNVKKIIVQIVIGIVVAYLAYQYWYGPVQESPYNIQDQDQDDITNDMILINQTKYLAPQHPHLHKYRKKIIYDTIDPNFSDYKSTEAIVKYFHKLSHVDLDPVIHYDTGMQFDHYHMGLKNDHNYCLKSDIYKLQHPETIYKNYFILSDFDNSELPREIMKEFGVDVMPQISLSKDLRDRIYDFPLETVLLNSRVSRFHHFHHYQECFFCLFQSSNHIPGKWSITGKDLVIDNHMNYLEKNFVDQKACINTILHQPNPLRLYNKTECEQFFQYLESDQYKQKVKESGIVFISKSGRDIHRGEGINIITEEYKENLQKKYSYGKQCGQNNQPQQIQHYISNPMLYNGRKIEVRIYVFIASTNPLIIYSQNLAHLRMCGVQFDKFSTQKEVHVCNVALSKKISNNFVVDFPLEGLQEYLLRKGLITDENWLQNKVYPQIYRAVTHIARSGEKDFLKDSIVNENFAFDFLLDDNSNLWFLENNPNPQILKMSEARTRRHYLMFGDMLEIQFAYLRSRFKRLQNLALQLKKYVNSEGYLQLSKEEDLKFSKEFKETNKNYLEPEFEIRKENTYIKVFDDNLKGEAKFMGNLPGACAYKE